MSLGDMPISTMKVSTDFHILQILIKKMAVLAFHDGSPYHIETSPLIWSANQWTGFL